MKRSGSWSLDGLRWWFLFGERLRVGIMDHRRWSRAVAAEGMRPWPCGYGYRYVHIGPYCLRLRGRPSR